MTLNRCDMCGKETFFSPNFKYAEIKDDSGNTIGYETVKMQFQNPSTGELEEKEMPKIIDLQPRAYKVMLVLGNETVQKDFCLECLESSGIRKQSSELFSVLGKISSQ